MKYWKPQSGEVTDEILVDALLVAGYTCVLHSSIIGLTQAQKNRAYDWAMRMHFAAAGNVRLFVPKKPEFLK